MMEFNRFKCISHFERLGCDIEKRYVWSKFSMSGRKSFQATDERSMWTISEEELKERETGEQWKECVLATKNLLDLQS